MMSQRKLMLLNKSFSIGFVSLFLGLLGNANAENFNTFNAPKDTGKELPVSKVANLDSAVESYFSFDNKSLIFNAKFDRKEKYHTFVMNLDGSKLKQINEFGVDACSFFFPDNKRIVFTSTKDNLELKAGNWSDPRNFPKGAELYTANIDGSNVKRLTNNEHYEAEVSVSPDGKWILFSRQLSGKLDLWRMRPDGSDEIQITHSASLQEGGAFYMPDSETIVFRAWAYEDELRANRPISIYLINHDGSQLRRLTSGDNVDWSPYPAPDGKHIIFAKLVRSYNFEIYMLNIATKKETRLTHNKGFDGFPSVSPDGKKLSFSSSRSAKPGERKLSLFIMDLSALELASN